MVAAYLYLCPRYCARLFWQPRWRSGGFTHSYFSVDGYHFGLGSVHPAILARTTVLTWDVLCLPEPFHIVLAESQSLCTDLWAVVIVALLYHVDVGSATLFSALNSVTFRF